MLNEMPILLRYSGSWISIINITMKFSIIKLPLVSGMPAANSGDKLLMRKLQYTIPAIRKGIRNLENCNYKDSISAPPPSLGEPRMMIYLT